MFSNKYEDYNNAIFNLSVDLKENSADYILKIDLEISSEFLVDLIKNKKAKLILIIKSKDNKIIELEYNKDNPKQYEKTISKREVAFVKNKTRMQVMIQAMERVPFSDNDDLNDFYSRYKDKICVDKGLALGFSSLAVFDGRKERGLNLYEVRHDSSIVSDIEIRLTENSILIVYKTDDIFFKRIRKRDALINPYLYMGLQKALSKFIVDVLSREENREVDIVNIDDINEEDMDCVLNEKILTFLKGKGIKELDWESIDKVIHLISEDMLRKYVDRIIEGEKNAD